MKSFSSKGMTGFILALSLSFSSFDVFAQINFVVNSTSDAADSSSADGNCDTGIEISPGVPECTLRAAIEQSNAAPEPVSKSITFSIPVTDSRHAGGIWNMEVTNSLPVLSANHVDIDASTQPGSSCGDMAALEDHDLKIKWSDSFQGYNFMVLEGDNEQSVQGFDLEASIGFEISGIGLKQVHCNNIVGDIYALRILDFAKKFDFFNNRLNGRGGNGILIGESLADSEIHVYGNTINEFVGITMQKSRGISIGVDASENIFGNTFPFGLFGNLNLTDSHENKIIGNSIQAGGDVYLISLSNSHDNIISKNILDPFSIFFSSAVQLNSSDRNIISENMVSQSGGSEPYFKLTNGSDDNIIGEINAGNIFRDIFNAGSPIQIGSAAADENLGNQIRYNVFANNVDQGIDLFPIGRNINDPGDADGGPNKGQNYPVLSNADALRDATGTDLTISYDVDSAPANSTYPITVHFYLADSDNEDAETYLGQDIYTVADYNSFAPGTKIATFRSTELLVATNYISATATDSEGNTSEISDPIPLDSFLPVELSDFQARIQNDRLYLNWTTLSEENNAGFEIELNAKGSRDWESLGFVEGAGTSQVELSYQFHHDIFPGLYLVRLKQLDFDGSIAYSPSISVESEVPIGGLISDTYPNPSNGISFFSYTSGGLETTAKIYDLQGVFVKEVFSRLDENGVTSRHQLDLSDLSSGMYFLRVVNLGKIETRKISLVR